MESTIQDSSSMHFMGLICTDVVYWTRPHRILLRGTELNLEALLWIALIVRIQKSVEISNMSPRVMK